MTDPQPAPSAQPSFRGWMSSMWVYTLLRFGLFFALWGLAYLVGLRGLFAPLVALVLSVPLSLVLLAKPRARFTRQFVLRMQARHEERARLDSELDPGGEG